MCQNEIYQELLRSLNPCSGIVQPANDNDDNWQFRIAWKGNIEFVVYGRKWGGGYCCVEKNHQRVSSSHLYKKIEDRTLGSMQKMINEVEYGKYNNKKTFSDKIQSFIEQKQLTSCMNQTKWTELLTEIAKIPNLEIMYKTLFDEEDPKYYWTIRGDEYLYHMNMASIEWFKIADTVTESKHIGRLVGPKVSCCDVKQTIKAFLEKHSINHEYIEDERCYVIYGYQ